MGIRIEQPGAARAAAAAGTAVGQATRAKEERARADRKRTEDLRLIQQQMADKSRQAAQQASMDWELQKMQINSQRAFERELRQEDYQLAAEDRAAAWFVEKAELTSRMDFERTEKERQRKLGVIDAKEAGIEKDIASGQSSREEYEMAFFNLDQERRAVELDAPIRASLTELPGTSRAAELAENRETRAQEVHERAAVGDPFKRLQQLDKLAQILSGFSENQEVDPKGWWGKNKKHGVPLAVLNEEGEWVEATEVETEVFKQTSALVDQIYKEMNKVNKYRPNKVADPNNMPDLPAGVRKGDVRVQSPEGTVGWLSQRELALPEYKGFRRL